MAHRWILRTPGTEGRFNLWACEVCGLTWASSGWPYAEVPCTIPLRSEQARELLEDAAGYAIEWGYPYGGPPEDPHCRFCRVEFERDQSHISLHDEDCLLVRINKFLERGP